MSFGEDVAEMYGDVQRGDEIAAVAFLEKLAGGGPALELAVGTGGSRCRSPLGVSASTESTSHRRWSRSYAPSRVATGSRSR